MKTEKEQGFYFPFGFILSATALAPAEIGRANISPNIPNPIAYNCFSVFGKNNKGIATPNIGSDAPIPIPIFAFFVMVNIFKVNYTNLQFFLLSFTNSKTNPKK